jgi:hypothetical protein
LGNHAQPFGTGKIETTAGDTEAIFGLSAEELGVQHGISRLSKRSFVWRALRRWVEGYAGNNANARHWFRR